MSRLLPVILVTLFTTVGTASAQDCQVAVLRRGPGGFSLRFETVPAGQSVTFVREQPERVLTAVVPVSPGVSGSVERGAETSLLLVRCDGDRIRVFTGPREGGASREVMSGARDIYRRYVIRVNVVGEDGERVAFSLQGGGIERADGPVLDLFRGKVPLGAGDVVVTTETREAEEPAGPDLTGSVPLGVLGPYAAVPVELPGGRRGRFILDLAATRSAVHRPLLPPETPIQRLVAVERSGEGKRELAASAQGAGGAAKGVGSVAQVEWLRVGDQRITDFRPLVLDEAFEVDGVAIDGVLGLDVLRRAGRIRASFGRPSGGSTLVFGPEPMAGAVEIPFREVRGLLFVEGRLGTVPVLLLLDSGARLSVLPAGLAERAGGSVSDKVLDSLRGVDGAPLPVRSARVPALRLGAYLPPSTEFAAGPIPVLDSLGLKEDAAILGQPFWRAIGVVEIDFAAKVMRVPAR